VLVPMNAAGQEVKRRALGLVTNLRGRSYEDRLKAAGMMSLVDRRVRGVMTWDVF
jgi:hypothetical protein